MHLDLIEIEKIFSQFIANWGWLIYGLIFLGLLFEGETILLASYFFVGQGQLNFWNVTLVAILGAFSVNMLWYFLGRWLKKITWIEKWALKLVPLIDRQLVKNPFRTLFISAFAYGTHRITLIRSGAMRMPFENFFKHTSITTICWVTIIGSFGFASSFITTQLMPHYLKFAEIGLLLGIIAVFLISRILSRVFVRE